MKAEYTNLFTLVANNNTKEVIIEFKQVLPKINDQGEIEPGSNREIVSTLIMSHETAKDLIRVLQDCVKDVNNEKDK